MPEKSAIPYFFRWLSGGLLIGVIFLWWSGSLRLPPPGGSDRFPERGFSAAILKAAPAVVSIITYAPEPAETGILFRDDAPHKKRFFSSRSPHAPRVNQTSSGSGVIISPRGYLLTNYHVIKDQNLIRVRLNDGRVTSARLIGTDPDTDLAVLKIDLPDLPTVKIGNSDLTRVGDIVLAIGDPFAIGQAVTQGIISATGRTQVSQNTYENFLQTDAAINPGNSGGALINTEGEIIGINSVIYSNSGNYQGISFAIPINLARHVSTEIITHGYVVRGWLGVEGQALTPEIIRTVDLESVHGILITDLDKGGPGDRAGIQRGDIITRINGHEIFNTSDIINMIADGKPGDVFRIEGIRRRQSFIVNATLGQRPYMSR